MDNHELIAKIYTCIEDGAIDKAVFTCLRLARNIDDIYNLVIFLREVSDDQKQFELSFVNETNTLNKDAQSYLWEKTLEYYVAERKIDLIDPSGKKNETVANSGIGELQRDIKHIEECIKDFEIPTNMHPLDTAVYFEKYSFKKETYRQLLRAKHTVIERIRSRCLNYASRIEKQLEKQLGNEHFLIEVQSSVNNYFAARSEDVYTKLMKASELIQSCNSEEQALLLTSVRRALKAVSDDFYPPVEEEIVCLDGKKRMMGNDQYLNRLQEFCMRLLSHSTSDNLLKEQINYFCAFMRRLNEMASKGVHAEVSALEAKQGLIGLYLLLSSIVNRIEREKPP